MTHLGGGPGRGGDAGHGGCAGLRHHLQLGLDLHPAGLSLDPGGPGGQVGAGRALHQVPQVSPPGLPGLDGNVNSVSQLPQSLQLGLATAESEVGINLGPVRLPQWFPLGSVDLDLNDELVELDLTAGVPTFSLERPDFLPVVSDSLWRLHGKNKFLGRIGTLPRDWLDSVRERGGGGGQRRGPGRGRGLTVDTGALLAAV